MPKVTASILEAMDRVAREAADTVGKLLNNNNNSYSPRHSHDQSLFHKLEVSWISIADNEISYQKLGAEWSKGIFREGIFREGSFRGGQF